MQYQHSWLVFRRYLVWISVRLLTNLIQEGGEGLWKSPAVSSKFYNDAYFLHLLRYKEIYPLQYFPYNLNTASEQSTDITH
jgi:hypothetical protein